MAAILAAAEPVPAQGLLVAVGLKTNRRSKVWCQAVEGTIPPALIKTLERELGEVEPVTLKSGPAGFGLKFALNGQDALGVPAGPRTLDRRGGIDPVEDDQSAGRPVPDPLARLTAAHSSAHRQRSEGTHTRSHAPRGNAVDDAPRPLYCTGS